METVKKIFSARNFIIFILIIKLLQIPLLVTFKPMAMLFSAFPYICVIWTLAVLVIDFADKKMFLKNTGVFWIILFLISYLITSIMNYRYSFADNIQLIFWMFLQYIIIYCCTREKNYSYNKTTIEAAAKVFVVIVITMIVLSFIMFFLGIGGEIIVDGLPMRFGLRSRRLFGVFASPNYSALFAVFTIVILTYFFCKTKNILNRILCIIAALLCYFHIIFTVSTTGKIVFLCASALLSFGFIYYNIEKIKAYKIILSVIASLVVSVILVLPFGRIQTVAAESTKAVYSSDFVQPLKKSVEKALSAISSSSGATGGDIDNLYFDDIQNEDFSFVREDFDDNMSFLRRVTHDRYPIWEDAIKLLFPSNPLFGVSALGYMDRINEEYPNSFISEYNKYSLHNDFVTLLVCCGIIGFAIMICFIATVISKVIKYLLKNKYSKEKLKIIWYPLVIVIISAISMFYSDAVIVNITIQSVVFWICMAYLMFLVDEEPKNNIFSRILGKIYDKLPKGKKT